MITSFMIEGALLFLECTLKYRSYYRCIYFVEYVSFEDSLLLLRAPHLPIAGTIVFLTHTRKNIA